MVLLFGVIAGIALALFRGGSLKKLGEVHIRWAWIVLVALIIQIILVYVLPDRTGVARVLFPLTHAAILVVAWVNRDLEWMWLVAAGVLLNFIVIVANGGYMPVTPQALAQAGLIERPEAVDSGAWMPGTKDIVLSKDQTLLWWFSDIVVLPPIQRIVSIGDILITTGVFLFVHQVMLQRED